MIININLTIMPFMKKDTLTLDECEKSSILKVVRLNAKDELKQRLISFGILKGAMLEVLEYAPTKSTMKLRVEQTIIALRTSEAKLIEVQKSE